MNVHFAGFTDEGLAYLNEEQARKLEGVTVEAGDVLLNITGASIGRVTIAPFNMKGARVNQHVAIIRTVEGIDAKFVSGFLSSPTMQEMIADENYGVTRQALTKSMIEDFRIPVPPLLEQRRIVAKIDSLSGKSKRACDQLDHIPRLVDKYKQAILAAAFRGDLTQEWRTLHKVQSNYSFTEISGLARVVTGSTPPTKDKTRFFGGSIPFFKPTDLDAGYHVLNARETLTKEGVAVSRPLPQSSVLVTCIGATIGKTGLARVPCCTNQQINGLVPDLTLVVPEWLYWMVVSPEFQQSILDNASATTLPIINKGRFERLSLPLPPLDEQREIVGRIERAVAWLDRLAGEAASARKLIDHLDQAVLAKAFRGELVPQDPNDEPASILLERIRAERAAAPARGKRRLM